MLNDKNPQNITVIGAGINGLVAANYLARAGHQVTLLERNDRVGGACVSETVEVDGIQQDYPLGATVLGADAGLCLAGDRSGGSLAGWAARATRIWCSSLAPRSPPGSTMMHRRRPGSSPTNGEKQGDLAAFHADEDRVVRFLQAGYRAGQPPSVEERLQSWGRPDCAVDHRECQERCWIIT